MTARKRLTLQDVAAVAGVSVRTVSNVINDFPHVSPETRTRVQAAVDMLGYRINPTARNLRRGSTGMLGLVVPELTQPYYAELAEIVLAHARGAGRSVLIERFDTSTDGDLVALLNDLRLMTDGILVSPVHLLPGSARLDDLDVPVVALTERLFDTGVDHVAIQDVAPSHAATAHLLALGRRRVAAVGADPTVPHSTSWLRERGFRDAHDEAGVPVDERLLRHVTSWDPEGGHTAMTALLADGLAPDAVYAFNDSMAIGVLAALAEHGLRVPDDVAVVGFDDVREARYLTPSLTTVSPGRGEAARRAVELLLARIDGTRQGPGEVFHTAFDLVVRGSSTP